MPLRLIAAAASIAVVSILTATSTAPRSFNTDSGSAPNGPQALPPTVTPEPLAACGPDDVDLAVNGEGAVGQSIVYLEVLPAMARPCSLDAEGTLTVGHIETGAALDVEGNPASGRITGVLRPNSNLSLAFVWTGCAPGDVRVDATHRVSLHADVVGFGHAQGFGQTPKCRKPGMGSQLVRLSH